jgi:NADPH-dependent F420 reductase
VTQRGDESVLGFIGGTGPEGRGLALRFALAGEDVAIGSRDASRAADAAESVKQHSPRGRVTSGANAEVADRADMVFIAVPFSSHEAMLRDLAGALEGKTVVDVVVPMEFRRGRASRVEVDEGSAAQQAQAILPGSTVVGAFHTTSAEDLLVPERSLGSDVVVCADDSAAKGSVMSLVELIDGARAVDGGGLKNAAFVEGFTVLLMDINRIYRAHAAIRIVGI